MERAALDATATTAAARRGHFEASGLSIESMGGGSHCDAVLTWLYG